jgi:hypothetical protein
MEHDKKKEINEKSKPGFNNNSQESRQRRRPKTSGITVYRQI